MDIEALKHLHADAWLSPTDIPAAEALLVSMGWTSQTVGFSAAGKPLNVLRYGEGEHVLAAYGYPHPDEPFGATALFAFAKAITEFEQVPWRYEILLCADPDGAALNAAWIENGDPQSYVRQSWHPYYLGLEVDYAFPIDDGPFLQPPFYTPPSGKAPLRESLAIANWLQRSQPFLLGLMHNEHVSGAYSFLAQRPSRELVNDIDAFHQSIGMPIHRGERPDPGGRWIRARTDFLKEKRLRERRMQLERHVGDLGSNRYAGCVSVSQFLESVVADAEILTPEVGLWFAAGIDSDQLSTQTRTVKQTVELTRRGQRLITRGEMALPDGSTKTVCYSIEQDITQPLQTTIPVTRGMLGVEAVELRRWFLTQSDLIWDTIDTSTLRQTPRLQEKMAVRVPARLVKDRAMLIFRTAAQYGQPATVAHAADFSARWNFHTARLLGSTLQLYREQGLPEAAAAQEQLLQQCEEQMSTLTATPIDTAIGSIIYRWLRTAHERYAA